MNVKVLVTQWDQTVCNPWTVVRQDPLSMGFSRQEYWCGLPFPSPGDLPNPGFEPRSPILHEYHSGEQSLTPHNESFSGGSDSIESALNVGDPGSTSS